MFKNESDFKKIVDRLDIDSNPSPAHRESLRRQMLSVFNEIAEQQTVQTTVQTACNDIFDRRWFIKRATAAAIAFGSIPAFAEIVRPLLAARTAIFKMTINIEDKPPQTVEGMFMEPGRTRLLMPNGVIQILDRHQGQMITLYPAEKKAIIIEMENVPEDKQEQISKFHEIRKRIQKARKNEDESVRFLGEKKINDVNTIEYHIENSGMDITVWADAKTLLPTRIEYSVGKIMGTEGTVIMRDIVFDEELDELLFSVPEGYDVHTIQYDASKPGEQDFIQALRLWSGTTNGKFPSELNIKTVGEFIEVIEEKTGLKLEKDKAPDPSDRQFQEFMRIYGKVVRGVGFAHRLPDSSDWHYTGKDAKFGDANTPVFWYRPEGSKTYRVIYADLSVENVVPENLPKQK